MWTLLSHIIGLCGPDMVWGVLFEKSPVHINPVQSIACSDHSVSNLDSVLASISGLYRRTPTHTIHIIGMYRLV